MWEMQNRVIKVASFLLLLSRLQETVRLRTDKIHGASWFANNPRTTNVHTSIIYGKCLIQGLYGDFCENLIKDVDYLRAKR